MNDDTLKLAKLEIPPFHVCSYTIGIDQAIGQPWLTEVNVKKPISQEHLRNEHLFADLVWNDPATSGSTMFH